MQNLLRFAAATASAALAKGNHVPGLSNFGIVGEKKGEFEGCSIWSLFDGVKRDDDTPCSIFIFDVNSPSARGDKKSLLQLARNALRKLRTLRHPDVLRFIDGTESDTAVYIVTEKVTPLVARIGHDGQIKPTSESSLQAGTGDEWRIWGLSKIVSALAFINETGKASHANLSCASVFVTVGGEWTLGGFELLTSGSDPAPVLYTFGGHVPNAAKIAPPEVKKASYTVLKDQEVHAIDAYHLHLFIQVLFNGPLPFSATPDSPLSRGSIPPALFQHYRRLFIPNGNPNARIRPSAFLATGNALDPPGFFKANRLVQLADGLDSFALAGESEKQSVLRTIKESLDVNAGKAKLPAEFMQFKVLPALVKVFEFGTGSATLLPIIISLGEASTMSVAEYDKHVLQPVVRAFASPDRAMRMALLDCLPTFVDRLDNRTVIDKIWPNLLTGFTDVVPVIREATVKSILQLAPKLSDRILNNDLLRQLAKTQTDNEPGIRTNTCILLGRLSKFLQASTNSKVLIPAFARAMRDPFVHARMAGLMALMATADCFSKEDLAGRIIPSMSITLVDKEKVVRDQGFKGIDLFIKKLEKLAASMPETALPRQESVAGNNTSAIKSSAAAESAPGLTNTAAGAASALAGWAFTSFAKRLAPADLQSGIGGQSILPKEVTEANAAGRPVSTPPTFTSQAPSLVLAPSINRTQSFADSVDSGSLADQGDWGPADNLMDVNGGSSDWDALDPFPVEEEPPIEFDSGFSRLSSRPPPKSSKPLRPSASRTVLNGSSQNKTSLVLSAQKPDIAADWDIDGEEISTADRPPQSVSPGWNDPPETHFAASSSSTPKKMVKAAATSVLSSFAPTENEADAWAEFDTTDTRKDDWSTGKTVSPSKATSRTPSAAGKSKVAQMREERKARLAALKNPPTSSSTPSSTFASGAQTQYRF